MALFARRYIASTFSRTYTLFRLFFVLLGEIMDGFKQRLLQAADRAKEEQGLSRRQIALKAGCSGNLLNNILNTPDLDTSPAGPGFFVVAKLCAVMGVTPNFLAGVAEVECDGSKSTQRAHMQNLAASIAALVEVEREGRPRIEQMISLYRNGGGRLEAFSRVSDYFDLFIPPSIGGKPIVYRAGAQSLATLSIGHHGAEVLQAAIDSVDDEGFHAAMLRDYSEAEERGVWMTLEEMNAVASSLPLRVKADYARLLFHVINADGDRYILNFSKLTA